MSQEVKQIIQKVEKLEKQNAELLEIVKEGFRLVQKKLGT